MDTLSLKSYAKLNLYLRVLGKRKDGYHNLVTVFERISLYDSITLTRRSDKEIRIICSCRLLPKDGRNLAYRAAFFLQKVFKLDNGVNIRISKRIPIAAGLGGGSSNAACVLLGLNRLWGLGLDKSRLASFAEKLGSDVPFFIHNYKFAKVGGRGEKVSPIRGCCAAGLWHVLVVPELRVSTELIYRKWDECAGNFALTTHRADVKILLQALRAKKPFSIAGGLHNDLEEITFVTHPAVKRLKDKLSRFGLKAILMSGSGPAVFAVTSSKKEAMHYCRRLKEVYGLQKVFAVSTF